MRSLLILVVVSSLSGCMVKPYQRELLAQPSMRVDGQPGGDAVEHALDSREGSMGAIGGAGGGCGCN